MFMQIRIKRKIFINTKRQPIGADTGGISKTFRQIRIKRKIFVKIN